MQKHIYIVLSKTNTALGKVIQKQLGVNYNHCSIALDESLEHIYSFGREEINNMFNAGFVTESKSAGFFHVYHDSKIRVIKVPVTQQQFKRLQRIINKFDRHKEHYKYSAMGLVYCYFGIARKRDQKYFCSQFVAEVLNESGVQLIDKPETLGRPHDFLHMEYGQVIYNGEIGRYSHA